MCQCTLFDVGGVEIHSIECTEYCTKKIKAMSKMSKIDQVHIRDVKRALEQIIFVKQLPIGVNATACTVLVKDYLEQHLCVSFACPKSMNLNSPFI